MRGRRFPLAIVVVALTAGACASGTEGPGGDAWSPVPAVNATAAPLLPTDALALPDVDAAAYQRLLGQLRGSPMVVNIWASWCAPCRSEAPILAAASRTYGSRVQFLGIDILDSRSSARAFIRDHGWRYPSVFDATAAVRNDLGFIGQPDTVFYDAGGGVAMTVQGPLTQAVLRRGLQRILPAG